MFGPFFFNVVIKKAALNEAFYFLFTHPNFKQLGVLF